MGKRNAYALSHISGKVVVGYQRADAAAAVNQPERLRCAVCTFRNLETHRCLGVANAGLNGITAFNLY